MKEIKSIGILVACILTVSLNVYAGPFSIKIDKKPHKSSSYMKDNSSSIGDVQKEVLKLYKAMLEREYREQGEEVSVFNGV